LIDTERLEMVKASMLSSIYMGIESSSGLNSFLSMALMKGEEGSILAKRVNEIKSINAEQIREIANETFSPEPLRAELRAV